MSNHESARSSRRWWHYRAARALFGFTVTAATFATYTWLVVPWVEPPRAMASLELPDTPKDAPELPAEYQPLFAPDGWEMSAGYRLQLRAARAYVIARELVHQDNPTHSYPHIRVRPCTVIMHPDKGTKHRNGGKLLLLTATDGAELIFDDDTELDKGNVGEVTAATLMGQVTLQQVDPATGAREVLLHANDIRMDGNRIWAEGDVDFQWQGARGQGQLMVVDLFDRQSQPSSTTNSLAGQVRSLQFDRLNFLSVPLGSGDKRRDASPPETLEVRCRGSMWVDFLQNVAVLDDTVNLFRHHGETVADQLSSDRLSLYFERGPELTKRLETRQEPQRGDTASNDSTKERIEIAHVVAEGAPVIGDIPSEHASVRCERLDFFPRDRRVEFRTRPGNMIEITRHSQTVRVADRVEYSWITPQQPNSFRAVGRGELFGVQGEDWTEATAREGNRFAIHWTHGAELIRDDGPLRLVLNSTVDSSRVRSVRIDAERVGRLQAQQVEVLLEEIRRIASTDANRGVPAIEVRPTELRAHGHVSAETEEAEVQTQNLIVNLLAPSRHLSEENQVSGPILTPPVANQRRSGPSDKRQPATERWKIASAEVRLQVAMAQDRSMEPIGAELVGAVDVQRIPIDSDRSDLRLQGDQLVATQWHLPSASLRVSGLPARITHGSYTVSTDEVQWQRNRATITLPRPGEIVSFDPKLKEGPIKVVWGRSMEFDGEVAVFDGGEARVTMTNRTDFVQADQCQVELARPIPLDDRATRGSSAALSTPQLARLTAHGRVMAEHRNVVAGVMTGRQRAVFPRVDYDHASGDIEMAGKGWLSYVGVGSDTDLLGSIAAPPVEPRADRSEVRRNEPKTADGLKYLRVDYHDQARGNLRTQAMTFWGDVETIYGPVNDWDDQVTFDEGGQMREGAVWISCQELLVARAPTGSGTRDDAFEVEARDRVRISGPMLTGQGDRLAYDQRKDRIVLEGSSRGLAKLHYLAQEGQAYESRQIYLNRSTGEVDSQFRRIDLGHVRGVPNPSDLP